LNLNEPIIVDDFFQLSILLVNVDGANQRKENIFWGITQECHLKFGQIKSFRCLCHIDVIKLIDTVVKVESV
jgi:hypothetical protein